MTEIDAALTVGLCSLFLNVVLLNFVVILLILRREAK
jgi:hypothetical protein